MCGLPSDFDASIFVGRTLEQVSFSANTIDFSFGRDLSITIEGSFTHKTLDDEDPQKERVPVMYSKLMRLTQKSVRFAEAVREGLLILSFEDGQVLSCFDDSPNYESYRISHGDVEHII